MVMERLRAAAEHLDNQGEVQKFAIEQAERLLKEAGVTDPGPSTQKPSVEVIDRISLESEWQRQVGRYVALGFPKELGLSPEDYCASLPKFEPQPESLCGRFDIPVLVETRIALSRQAELAGLQYHLGGGLSVCDWDDPKDYKTPDSPYITWMQDGKKNLNKSVRDVRRDLEIDERGATEHDGVALWVTNPSVLDDHYIDLPGTSVGSDYAPYLHRWDGRPRVGYCLVGYAYSGFGSASCGRVTA